jgi:hypothetical protein
MPHYYIDVRSSFGLDEDLDGLELPDLSAAHAEALIVAHRLRERWTDMPHDARHDIVIEIVDEGFRTILTLPLSEVETGMKQAQWELSLRPLSAVMLPREP